jgi:hypothetical protein
MATIHCHVQIEQGLEQLGISQSPTPCTPGLTGGEANVGANVGDGEGLVYEGKDGVTLNFRTIKAGPNMTVVTNEVERRIEINSILGGGNVTGPDPSTVRGIATYADTTGQVLLDNGIKIDTAAPGSDLAYRAILALDDDDPRAWHDLIQLNEDGAADDLIVIVGGVDTDLVLKADADPRIVAPGGTGTVIHTKISNPWTVEKSGAINLPTEPDTTPIWRLGTGGTNGAFHDTYVGVQNPEGAISAVPGSFYHRVDGANSALYQHKGTATGSTGWALVGAGAGGDFSTSVSSVTDEMVLIFDGITGKLGKASPVRIQDVASFHRIQIMEPSAPNAWRDTIQIADLAAGSGLVADQYVALGCTDCPVLVISDVDPMVWVGVQDASKMIHEKIGQDWEIENEGMVSTPDEDITPPFAIETKGSTYGAKARDFVGNRNPVGLVFGDPGDFYKRSDGENSRFYQHRGASGNNLDWQEIAAGGGGNTSNVWIFSTSTSDADPGTRRFRLNNVTLSSATQMFINYIADDLTDMAFIIKRLSAGDAVYIQQQSDHSIFQAYEVTGATVDATTYGKVPLSWNSGNGVFTNNAKYTVSFIFAGGGGGPTVPNVGFYATGPSQTLLNNTKTLVNFDGVRDDAGGDFSTSTNFFTAPTAGRYVLTGTCQITTNPGSVAHLGIETSVHGVVGIDYAYVPNAGTLILNVATTIYMDAGETAGLYAQQFSGFTATIQAAEKTFNGTQIMAV